MALSDENAEKVEPYSAQYDLPFPVAAGSGSNRQFSQLSGARGIPHSYLVDHEGTVIWEGHPGSLSKGTVEKAVKAAPKLANPMLALHFSETAKGALGKAYAAASSGKLAEALKGFAKVSADERSSSGDRASASDAAERIESHVGSIMTQIEKALERGHVLPAVRALDMLSDELKGHASGTRAANRLAEVTKDKVLANEIKGAEALEKALELGAKRGMKKAKGKLEAVIKNFPGTKAADRARAKIAAL